jgi:uncharacterized paraquat-inducible protein A
MLDVFCHHVVVALIQLQPIMSVVRVWAFFFCCGGLLTMIAAET